MSGTGPLRINLQKKFKQQFAQTIWSKSKNFISAKAIVGFSKELFVVQATESCDEKMKCLVQKKTFVNMKNLGETHYVYEVCF